jgi:subtilase family serine protease
VTIPAGTVTGSYYVIAKADATGLVSESSETNNTKNTTSIAIGPDLSVTAVSAPAAAGAGLTITVSDTTTNSGAGTAAASVTRFFLSANLSLDSSDTLIGARNLPVLGPGASDTKSSSVTIPAAVPAGIYYVIAQADAALSVLETSESNNTRASSQLTIGADRADLTVLLAVPPPAGAGRPVVITDTTSNKGVAPALPTSTRFYLSANSTFDATDVLLGSRAVPALDPGATSTASTTLQIPAATGTGTYYVIAVADATGSVPESNENNNRVGIILFVGPDLVISTVSAPSTAPAGSTIAVSDGTKNQGGGPAALSVTRYYLSNNTSHGSGDTLLGTRIVGGLEPGATDSGTVSVQLPANLAARAYFIVAVADDGGQVAETVEGNNTKSSVRVSVTTAATNASKAP